MAQLAVVAPFIPVAVALLLVAHGFLYSLLKRGAFGPTPALLMTTPVLVYLVCAVTVAVLAAWFAFKRHTAARWYFLSAALLAGGLVMALVELDHYLQVV